MRQQLSSRRTRVERKCVVTVNESLARDDVLVNIDVLDKDIQPGTLMALDVLRSEADKPPQTPLQTPYLYDSGKDDRSSAASRAVGVDKRYIFIVKDMPKELKARHPNVEVFVPKHIADAFGMKKGSQVLLTPVREMLPVCPK
jgi:hypothetical protein